MSTSRRGFLGRLFGGAVAAAVPPSWYLRQGLPVPPDPMPALPGWTPIDPAKYCAAYPADYYNAKCIACAEHIDAFITGRAKQPFGRYNPDTFRFAIEGIEHTGVKA